MKLKILWIIGSLLLSLGGALFLWNHLVQMEIRRDLASLEALVQLLDLSQPLSNDHLLLCLFEGEKPSPCPWTTPTLEHDLKLVQETKTTVVNLRQAYLLKPHRGKIVLIKLLDRRTFPYWIPGILVLDGVACLLLLFVYARRHREKDLCCEWLARWTGKEERGESLVEAAEEKERELRRLLVQKENAIYELEKEIVELRQRLRKMQEDLAMAQQALLHTGSLTALGEFAAAISHELNNPLGIILGFTQHILEELSPDHPHYPKLKRIETELERCRRIIHDLLAFARPAKPNPREIDPNEFIEELVRFALYEKPGGIEVECYLEEGLPKIFVDPEQLEQVLLNLIKNAIEAMGEQGKLTITTRLGRLTRRDCFELALPSTQPGALDLIKTPEESMRLPEMETKYQPGDPAVIIEVSDTGPGIPEELISKIFNPFFTTKKGGTGLGLSISWKLVRRNGGLLRCKSAPGKGATFQIILPVKKQEGESPWKTN